MSGPRQYSGGYDTYAGLGWLFYAVRSRRRGRVRAGRGSARPLHSPISLTTLRPAARNHTPDAALRVSLRSSAPSLGSSITLTKMPCSRARLIFAQSTAVLSSSDWILNPDVGSLPHRASHTHTHTPISLITRQAPCFVIFVSFRLT